MLKKVLNKILNNKILLFSFVVLFSVLIEAVIFNGYNLLNMRHNLGNYNVSDNLIKTKIEKETKEIDLNEKRTIYDKPLDPDASPNYQEVELKKYLDNFE